MAFFLIILLIILSPYNCFSQHGIAITYKTSEIQTGIYMDTAFSFDSFYSSFNGHCALICASRTPCKSLNFYSRNRTCQLNTMALKDIPSGKMTDKDAIYMDKEDIKRSDHCSTYTCSETEACVSTRHSAVCSKLDDYRQCSSKLPTITHANVSSSCLTAPGSVCELMCKDNYIPTASGNTGYIVCLAIGEWSIIDPKCKHSGIFDCQHLKSIGYNTSGVYNITVKGEEMEAYCDMETEGGGWTVVTKRFDGSVNFNQSWNAYKVGFGHGNGEYWLGNEYIHILTWERNYEAYFKLKNLNGSWRWAWYPELYIHSEEDGYTIRFNRTYKGNAGQTLDLGNSAGTIQGMHFSTYDKDQDLSTENYAKIRGGGWWYKRTAYSVLTATYESISYAWRDTGKLLASTMMVRPVQ